MQARYFPEIFQTPDLDGAKRIILTDEGPGAGTEARWASETPYVLELVTQAFALRPKMVVLDYGSGVGRIAKAMIEASGCTVIGLDTSAEMLRLGADYVASERFIPVTPVQFDALCRAGLRVDALICVWVLQHCFAPADEIARMQRSLAPDGRGFVLNMPKRAVPALVEEEARFCWASDEQDVAALLRASFTVTAEGAPDPSRTPNMADAGAFWMHIESRLP